MKTEFKIVSDLSTILEIADALFLTDADAPVFYSAGMLQSWQKVTGRPMQLAVLYESNMPIVALPIETKKFTENISYPGWDNLNVLRSSTCSDGLEFKFWLELVKTSKILILSSFTQKHLKFNDLNHLLCIKVPMRKCPYIELNGGWDFLNQTLGKKLVRNIRQYGNKATEAGIQINVKLGTEYSLSEKKQGLGTSYTFHNTRMQLLGQVSKFSPQMQNHYHEEVLKTAKNVFIIEALNGKNECVAWYYGLFNRSRLAWFNGGYHPDYQTYSIGTLLVARLIDFALANQMQTFDFLRGNEGYKQKWTQKYNHNQTIYLASTGFKNAFILNKQFFSDTRKRMGTRRALKKLYKALLK